MKQYLTTFAILTITACSLSLRAQDSIKMKQDPIDIQLSACMDSTQNQTTAGMVDCEVRAKTAWDRELNKYYRLLMGTLSPDEKNLLKASQLSWLTYRDNEAKFSSIMYNDMEGTMWQPVGAGADVEITKQRALELKSYYQDKQSK